MRGKKLTNPLEYKSFCHVALSGLLPDNHSLDVFIFLFHRANPRIVPSGLED
jgi:hypothetical protein